ncbi:uncharacterized protein Bfra_004122 [Botrytis fragariae]|uniref:Uncharacterized protein n=1 Tax=Botrytis fragariae TaxID=1964551 RepID=A0A8H6AVF1_9HELO|nr:uncharacterized protein Bfra_004122 [Botrytis fragariae]KAF5874115.1 hypothetical protein Bfra_004122 [Botrytis fragariae]
MATQKYLSEQVEQGYIEIRLENKEFERAIKSQSSGESFEHRRREEDRHCTADSESHTVDWHHVM